MFNMFILVVFCQFIFVPAVFGRQYAVPAEINLPEPPAFLDIKELGRKTVKFLGVDVFTRELRNIDFSYFFERGKMFITEKVPQYQAKVRSFCPYECNLPDILSSIWIKIKNLW